MQNDYIDFKFGDHWASEFNLLAVSSSDRYTPPVYGNVNPNIATIMGKKGVYKWKTQVNEKIFNINIAFDSVTIAQLNQIKQWLQPNKIQKLIFSEEPYKYYWAALNAEIDFSHLPFVEGEKQVGERTIIEGVYKGEIVISFVCIDNDGYSTEGTFEGLETENPSNTIKGNDFVLTDADNDYIDNLKIEGKSEQETKYNNTLSDTDFADVNSRSVEKAWKTNNLAQIQAKNGEVTISAPYQYSGIAQEQREALIDHKYFASAEINTDSLDTALEIAGKNITNSIEGKDINIIDGLVGPVDDLVVSGDASQDKFYNNEINSSFLEDLNNWNNQNNGQISINKQKATVIANEKYDGVSQRTEENNVGDKYYVKAKIQSNNTETALEVETEKGSAEGSNITINDASDNKLENIRIEGKHSQEHYDQKDLGEGEIISYNNTDNYQRYTKVSVSGNSAQEVVEEVPGTEVEGDNLTVNGITVTNKELDINGNVKQDIREGKNIANINDSEVYKPNSTAIKIEGDKINVTSNNNPVTSFVSIPLDVEPNTDYMFSGIAKVVSNSLVGATSSYVKVREEKNSGSWVSGGQASISQNNTQNQKLSFTFNSGEHTRVWLWLYIKTGGATRIISVDFSDLQVEKGTEKTEYEKYGKAPSSEYLSPITVLGQNTNLFNATDSFQKRTVIGLTFTPIEDSSIIKVNGTATANVTSFLGNDIKDIFEIGKTYYAYTNNENFEVLFELYGVDVEVPIKTVDNFVMSSEYTRINLVFKGTNLNGKTYNNEEIGIKIEEGKITNYTPYGQGSCSFVITNGDKTQKQEFVLPIQKPMLKEDYFDFKNKKEIHHWSKTAFTGEEKWALNATYTNTVRFSLGVSYLNANKIGYCNRSFIRTTQVHGDYEYMFYSSDLLYFNISKSSLPADKQNLEGFTELLKQWNSEGEPLELYYQTGEIEELTLTDEQIAVGQEIDKAKLYLGTTRIYSNDEIAPYFTLVYNHILPSPSPEFPSKIKNVGDNINLINEENLLNYTSYGATVTSTVIQASTTRRGYLFECKPNTAYTIQRGDTTAPLFRGFCFDENPIENPQAKSTNGAYADTLAGPVGKKITFKTTANSKYIYVVTSINEYTTPSVKAEEGETATSYSPYNCGNIGVNKTNSNILPQFEETKESQTINGITITKNSDGTYTLNGTSTGIVDLILFGSWTSEGVKLRLNKGILYFKTNSTKINGGINCFSKSINKSFFINVNSYFNNQVVEDVSYVFIRLCTGAGVTFNNENVILELSYDDVDNLEVNKNDKIVFPLKEGQKLMKGDYLARDGIHHKRKQIELDGTENWSLARRQFEKCAVFFISGINNGRINKRTEMISNQFIFNDMAYNDKLDIECITNNLTSSTARDLILLQIKKERLSEVSTTGIKTWLAEQKAEGTPVIVEYELAEEEVEEYTKTQKEKYDNLTHLTMYNGQNTLTTSNKLKPQLKWEIPESPSPDYPIEIKIIKDNIKMTSYSANELNLKILTAAGTKECKVENKKENEITITSTAKIGSSYIRFKKKVKAGTWYFKKEFEILSGIGTNYTGRVFIQDTSWNNILILNKNLKEGSFTLKEDKELYITLIVKENIDTNTEIIKIKFYNLMLSNNNVDFVTYKQDNAIVPIQQEMLEEDYIDLKTNMEAHTWNYIELDETANWNKEGELENVIRVAVSTGKTSDSYEGKCTHFNFIGNYNLDEEHVYVTYTGLLYVFINKEIASTAEEFKTWLVEQKEKGTPVRVYWKADKTSGTVLTSEQKTELQKLRSYREITNIISNDVLQPNIKIEYIKKPSYTTKLTGNTEQLLSLIYQTNIDKTKILLDNISDNDNSFTFTHPILINLTKQFGSGKEPTKEWLDTNIDFWDVAEGGAPSVETSSRVKTVGSNINLFDPDNHIELDGQYRHYSEGEIVGSANFFGIKIPVLGNMVYSVNSNFSRNGYSNLCYYDKDFTFMWGEPFTEGQTFRTPFNCRYITLALNKNYDWFTLTYGEIPIQKVDYNLANIDMQISGYDSQFKSFPLAEGQELLQLSDGTQDTLEADGIHKRVGKLIVTGNEKWGQYNRQLHTYFGAVAHIAGANGPIFCNRLINNNTYVYNTTGEAAACLQENYLYMCIKRKDFGANDNMSVDECFPLFRQFLKDEYSKGNPFIYYYRKAEEEIIPYSNAQKAWYDDFEIYRKNTQITTIAETKPWYSFTYDINDTYSVNSTKVNEYEKLGLIFNNLEDRPRFIVNRTADGSGTIKMRKPLVVDLTNAFGAGKEPDLAWCLENITFDNSCEYGTPSPNVPSELLSVGSNPIKIENKSRNLIKEQNLLNWTKEYCTAERLTEKYDNRNIYRISFENHKKGTISTRIQQKKGNMVLSIYARVIQADDPTVNRLVVAKVTSDSSSSTPVSHKSLENLIGEWQKIYIPITAKSINDAAELVLEVQHNADTDDSTIIDLCMPQLEEGFTPHDYIPYAPEKVNNLIFTTPLRQLKNGVRDEFSKDGIIRRIGEHTIKSTDTVYWIVFNQDKDYVTICGKLGIYIRGDNAWKAPSFYCNRIEDCTYLYAISQGSNSPSSRTKEGIGIIDSEYRMCLRADLMGIVETDTEEDMIRKYKVLLDEKPFIIYYEKEVADIEPLTELQKNTLANLVTRKQYDHWLVSGDLNPEVELSYKLTSSINDIHPWVTGSNLLDKTWFYNDNNIHTKPYVEVDTGDADKSGISATRPIYLLNSGTETANLSLTFDYINIETPLTIQTYSGKFTDDGFVEEAKVSEITIEPFTNYQPFKDIYDNNPANWKIEIDSALGEVYLRHNTDETKVLNLNRFNKDHTFLSLADCNFVDYDKVFPTIISEIEGTAIENTIFNKVIVANTADNYRLKNVNVEWKHTYL